MTIIISRYAKLGRAIAGFFVLLALASLNCGAQTPIRGWTRIPTIVIVGEEGDPRESLVRDAVNYWNATLAKMGSSFRLGGISVVQATIPGDYLLTIGKAMGSRSRAFPPPPAVLGTLPGDLVVIFSDLSFISFGGIGLRSGQRVVAIKGMRHYPMMLPNVPLNVIIHELGHGIGLGHNDNPAALMCGRPAPCEPTLFQSSERKIFPLLESDKAALLKLYPEDWQAQ